MGRRGIEQTDVVRAYVSLLREGRRPTLLNMRLQLGRGSYSTIASRLVELRLVGADGQLLHGVPIQPRGRGRPRRVQRLDRSARMSAALV